MQELPAVCSGRSGTHHRLHHRNLSRLPGKAFLHRLHRSLSRFAVVGSHKDLSGQARMTAGLDIGGYEQRPEWPKMGPSLLIASCLILAIRTAKRSPHSATATTADRDLEVEIEYAIRLAGRVFSMLVGRHPSIFPQKPEPWFVPNGHDVPK